MNCEKCGTENLLAYQDGNVIDCLDCYHRKGERAKRKPGKAFMWRKSRYCHNCEMSVCVCDSPPGTVENEDAERILYGRRGH